MDSGMFKPLQLAAVQALSQGKEWFDSLNAEYALRRQLAGRIFDLLGAEYEKDSAGMFLWGKVDAGLGKEDKSAGECLSDLILNKAGVFITPGFIFGKNGENYIRISLCAKPEVLSRAEQKIRRILEDKEHLDF